MVSWDVRSGLAGVSFLAFAAAVLAGCPRADLVACGELACPADATCRAGACVPTAAVEACADQPALADCATPAITGQCVDGVCTPVGCGNGVVDDGEVCDDGNTDAGDGCRADCRGLEACGDGFRDPGETCDCGADAASQPPNCLSFNSDDPTAECDLACGRFCGDGLVTGLEQCDGTDLAGRTCGSLGFYTGELACAQCVFDATSCAERCGDGLVQASGGEDCDGAPPAYGCTDLGSDLGHLSCTARCTANVVNDCGRFGWQAIQVGQRVVDVWTDGTHVAMVLDDRAVVRTGAASTSAPGAYAKIAGDATGIWFVGFAKTVHYAPATATWSEHPGVPGSAGDPTIAAAGIDPMGRLMVMRDIPCNVLVLDGGTWVDTGIGVSRCFGGAACDGDVIAYGGELGGVARWNGTAWVPVVSGVVHDLEVIDGALWVATTSALYRDGVLFEGGEYQEIAGGGGTIYAARSTSIVAHRPDERVTIPVPGGVWLLAAARTGKGPLVSSTSTVVSQLTHGAWLTESPPSALLQTNNVKVHAMRDGVVVIGQGAALSDTQGWLSTGGTPTAFAQVWGTTRDDFWAAGPSGLYRFERYPSQPPEVVTGPWGATAIQALGGSSTGRLLVATFAAVYRDDGAGGWTTIAMPMNCVARGVAGGEMGAEYVVGSCGNTGALWQIVGDTLDAHHVSLLPNSQLHDVTVTSDGGAFAIGSREIVRWDGTTATATAIPGTRIAGSAPDDVWAVAPALNGEPPLLHWDGASWARVRTADNATYLDVTTRGADVFVVRNTALQRLLRPVAP